MRVIGSVILFGLLIFWRAGSLSAELTKTDVEEIRKIVKEEIQYVDKRIDDLRDTLRSEIGTVRSEISDIKTANKDIKSEIKDVRAEIKDVRADIKDVRVEIKEMRSELQDFLLWGFGIVFAGIFALIGFVLWDRRTAIAPAIRKNMELEERENKVEQVLKEYAKGEPRLKEILKHIGLM